MTSTMRKEPSPSARTFEPKVNLPDRRHSIAHQPSPPDSRRGSTTSQHKTSDSPSWLTGMNERNASVGSAPDTARRSSVAEGVKGLFGRRKSHDEKPKQKMVITSKHAGKVKNNLKADPRNARKVPVVTASVEGINNSTHLSAAQQEQRRPHSGSPVKHTELPMLARIISEDERDDEESSLEKQGMTSQITDSQALEKIHESEHEDKDRSTSIGMGEVVEEKPARRKSLIDVEIKGAEKPRSPRGSLFGRYHRNERGIWTK